MPLACAALARDVFRLKLELKLKMIRDVLEKSQREKSIIGLWIYGDDEGFWSGYVKDLTKEFIVFQHFTKYGRPDGVIVEKISNIQSIDFDDDYAKVMAHLIEHGGELEKEKKIELNIHHTHTWQMDILEPFIGNKDTIVKIQVNRDSFYSGFVEWVSDEFLVLRLVGSNGEDNGKSMFRIEDVNTIRINEKVNRKRMMLYKWRKGK